MDELPNPLEDLVLTHPDALRIRISDAGRWLEEWRPASIEWGRIVEYFQRARQGQEDDDGSQDSPEVALKDSIARIKQAYKKINEFDGELKAWGLLSEDEKALFPSLVGADPKNTEAPIDPLEFFEDMFTFVIKKVERVELLRRAYIYALEFGDLRRSTEARRPVAPAEPSVRSDETDRERQENLGDKDAKDACSTQTSADDSHRCTGQEPSAMYLDIHFHWDIQEVSRDGIDARVELAGKKLDWHLLLRFASAKGKFVPPDDLDQIWRDHGRFRASVDQREQADQRRFGGVLDHTKRAAISKLSKKITPLGVKLENRRNGGWRLIEIGSGREKRDGASRRRP